VVRTVATYRDRLLVVLQVCIEIQAKKGVIRVKDVAERLDITERVTRDYLNDLETLGFLKYEGAGAYRVIKESVHEIARALEKDTLLTLSMDELIPKSTLDVAEEFGITKKVSRILQKLGVHVSKAKEIRELLLTTSPKELNVSDIIKGEKIIQDKESCKPLYLHNVSIGGEASDYLLSNYVISDLFPLSISYIAACAVYSSYEWDMLSKSQIFLRPRIEQYAEKEPYQENELFYELSTEYPELLIFGRKIASRLLKELQRYNACIDLLNNTDAWILFTKGSLIPHGFILAKECRRLARIHDKISNSFRTLLNIASKKDALIVGVTSSPRDMRFFNILEDKLKLRGATVNDYIFLKAILKDGDFTSPMLVERERGKDIENYYEFYLNAKGEIIKFEFITNKDPIEVQRKILSTALPLITPSPFKKKKTEYNLSVIFEAKLRCDTFINVIKRHVEVALRHACVKFIEQIKDYARGRL